MSLTYRELNLLFDELISVRQVTAYKEEKKKKLKKNVKIYFFVRHCQNLRNCSCVSGF
jgi:hypothetical protein